MKKAIWIMALGLLLGGCATTIEDVVENPDGSLEFWVGGYVHKSISKDKCLLAFLSCEQLNNKTS